MKLLMSIITCLLLFTAFSSPASPVETFEFTDEVTKIRFQALSKELRCPKCQNQNLADSNSPIAEDLRRELYELLQQGKADSEIVNFMVWPGGTYFVWCGYCHCCCSS